MNSRPSTKFLQSTLQQVLRALIAVGDIRQRKYLEVRWKILEPCAGHDARLVHPVSLRSHQNQNPRLLGHFLEGALRTHRHFHVRVWSIKHPLGCVSKRLNRGRQLTRPGQ